MADIPSTSGLGSRSGSSLSSVIYLVEPASATASAKSLNVITATVFIVGSICGGGVLAIPQAIVDCGVIGSIVLIVCGCISSFTGYLLGQCWTVLRIRYPEYEEERMTDPYPTIAFRAGGKIAKVATRVCIDITLFGGATVFLLLISGNISQLIYDLGNGKEFSLCYVMLIVTAILIPVCWLGTPKDFWQIAAIAAASSILAAIFVFASLMSMTPASPSHSSPNWPGFFNAFGTILFAFGGASCFPTIQVDMKEPQKFPTSAVLGITIVMTVYLLVGIPGYAILGDDMKPNIIEAIPSNWMSTTVNFLITFHLMMACIIIFNPIAQDIEGIFDVPDKFCFKRIVVRTILPASSMFLGLTIPHFNVLLALLGGSTIACTNFIFPPLFYYLLSRQTDPSKAYGALPSYIADEDPKLQTTGRNVQMLHEWIQIHIPLHIKVLLAEIMAIGILGGACSTYFSFASLINGESGFTVPCYVDPGVGLPK